MNKNQTNENQTVDESVARELVLTFENNEPLYNRRDAWITNFNRKIKRGVFNEEKAITGVVYLVEETIKHYRKEFGLPNVNKATKIEAAKQIYESSIKEDLNL